MRINNLSTKDLSNNKINFSSSRTKKTGRVDINDLMSRVRADHKKQKTENLVFVCLVGSIVVITGIIASL